MTVHSTEGARLRDRIAAHARRLFVEGQYRSMAAFSRALRVDDGQVWRVLTGERTAGIAFLLAMHKNLGADLNIVLATDPSRRWFRPLSRRPVFEWE